ncbi:MAG: CDP-alcohol phosphatidyltransferase family protein [Bacteroidetes bacterium]|nr:CDP-alcohol phosphatidyltransferase family protein [Bacteroidota bacterium]
MKQIPNIFTLFNLFFGCLAIIFCLQTNTVVIYLDQQYNSSFNIPEKLTWAAIFIIIAALIDFLDGFLARLLNAVGDMGKQLDSLSDVVSFGVAPSMIIYQLLRFAYARQENGLETSIIWMLPAMIIAMAAAYRLAKFNLSTDQQYYFKGVPVPAIGLLVASFPMILHFNSIASVSSVILSPAFLYILILVVSYLMVSNHLMLSLKKGDIPIQKNKGIIILFLVALVSAIFLQWLAVPIVFIFYIIISLLSIKKTAT